MSRKPRAKAGELRDVMQIDIYFEANWAREQIERITLDKGVGGPEAINAIGRLIAVSEPGSPIRSMCWNTVATLISMKRFSADMCRRPRWPNPAANETLVT